MKPIRKAALIADLHLGLKDNYGGRVAGSPCTVRLNDKIGILSGVIRDLNQERVETLIVAGDVFDYPNIEDYVKALFYGTLSSFKGEIYILLGNHDFGHEFNFNFNSDRILTTLINDGRLHIVSKPVVVDVVMLCPWLPMEYLLAELGLHTAPFLVGHWDIAEAKVGLSENRKIDVNVPLHVLEKFRMVFSGHNHLSQRHTTKSGLLWGFIGSLYRNNFGEEGYQPCYYIVDFEMAYTIGVSESVVAVRHIADRSFRTITYDCALGHLYDPCSIQPGSVVKLRIQGTREALVQVDQAKLKNEILERKPLAIFVEPKYIASAIAVNRSETDADRIATYHYTMSDKFKAFSELAKVDPVVRQYVMDVLAGL